MSEKRVVQHQFQLTRPPMLQNDDSKVIGYEYMMVSPDESMVIHNSAIDSDPLDFFIASNTYNENEQIQIQVMMLRECV